jgi:hypothetical protein
LLAVILPTFGAALIVGGALALVAVSISEEGETLTDAVQSGIETGRSVSSTSRPTPATAPGAAQDSAAIGRRVGRADDRAAGVDDRLRDLRLLPRFAATRVPRTMRWWEYRLQPTPS